MTGPRAACPGSYGSLLAWAAGELATASDSARLDAELLLAHAAGHARSAVLAYPERVPDAAQADAFCALVRRRASGTPLAYLTGTKSFYSVTLAVTCDVLVPRPATELLVDEALAAIAALPRPRVLDLGTGSGAIALAVKRECPHAEVTAADVHGAALALAQRNAAALGLEVAWVRSDWFAALAGQRFDAILCNPPYVRSDDPHFDGPLRFEPRLALDGGADGLEAVRAVAAGARAHLVEGGLVLLEHGYDQREAVVAIARAAGYEVAALREDPAGQPRLAVLRAPAGAAS